MSSKPLRLAVVVDAIRASLDVGVQVLAVVLLAIDIGNHGYDHTYFNTAPLL